MSLTGEKRKRDEDEDEEDEELSTEPPEKKRKIDEVSDEIIEELFNFFIEFFKSSSAQLNVVRNNSESMQEKLMAMIDIVKKDRVAKERQDVRMMIFLVEYFRHGINPMRLGRMLSNAGSGDFSMIRSFFVEKMKPNVEQSAIPFLEQNLTQREGRTINKESIETSVKKQFEKHSNFFDHFICGMVDEIIDSQQEEDGETKDEDDDDDEEEESEIISQKVKTVSIRCPFTQDVMFRPLRNPNCGHHYSEIGVKNALMGLMPGGAIRCPKVGCSSVVPPLSQLTLNPSLQEEITKQYQKEHQRIDEGEKKKIDITLKGEDGSEVIVRMTKTTRFERIRDAYAKRLGLSPCSFRFSFEGDRLDKDSTPEDVGVEDHDIIDVYIVQSGGKPVVLLYPPKDNFKVESVKVSLNEHFWNLHCHYPPVSSPSNDNSRNVVEWKNMNVMKNGEIQFSQQQQQDDHFIKKHEYLFWESKSNQKFDFSNDEELQLISRRNVVKFLTSKLLSFGLLGKEVNNFITFWMNLMMKKEYVLFQFMNTANYEKRVKLEVTPQPQKLIKIFLLFLPIDSPNDIQEEKRKFVTRREEGQNWVNIDDRSQVERVGYGSQFIVVEWGGMNIEKSDWVL